MEKINIVLMAIGLLIFSFGCQNTTDPNIEEEIKNVSVSSSEVFEYKTGISGDEFVVLTNGFKKKSQKTPKQEIELAEQRKADYLARNGGSK